MAVRRAFQAFLILALVSGCIGSEPCTDYDLMWMEYGLRSSDFYSKNTSTSICDAFLDHDRWYRFEHDAGNRLIEKPVEPWYCGTQSPIWLNGTHPTDATEVTANVCATYTSENICGWNGTVRIQLCNESGSEYFVYLLAVPPGCPLAYCVDAASRKQCIPPEVWLEDEFRCGDMSSEIMPTTMEARPTSGELPQPTSAPAEVTTPQPEAVTTDSVYVPPEPCTRSTAVYVNFEPEVDTHGVQISSRIIRRGSPKCIVVCQKQCSASIATCTDTPCRNNGTCVDISTGYRCECPLGFTGTNCEQELDCDGVTCVQGLASYGG